MFLVNFANIFLRLDAKISTKQLLQLASSVDTLTVMLHNELTTIINSIND